MKKKNSERNKSGISICDSIVMSVKKKRMNLRQPESVFIAVMGYVSVIMAFLSMFRFNYKPSSVLFAAVIFSIIYITLSLIGRRTVWIVLASVVAFVVFSYKVIDTIGLGYKYVYNVIYHKAYLTEISYYKFLKPEMEEKCTTAFFIMCVWFLAIVIYYFTICRPNLILPIAVTFPVVEIGLYNGIEMPLKWGVLIIAYWLALFAMSTIDLGEYSGGNGGFVRKDNLFFPKRQMRLKVTEACGMMVIVIVIAVSVIGSAAMKITGYHRSDELNRKRINIRDAVSSFTVNDIADSISNIANAFGFSFKYENHKLGTVDRLRYKNRVDLKVTVDRPTDCAIYLKDYTGSVYSGSDWDKLSDDKYNTDTFSLFDKYNMHPQDFPGVLLKSKQHQFISKTQDDGNGSSSIEYIAVDDSYSALNRMVIESKLKNDKTFIPYNPIRDTAYRYLNDTLVLPKKKDSRYSVYFIPQDAKETFNSVISSRISSSINMEPAGTYGEADLNSINEYCTAHDKFTMGDYFTVDSGYSCEYNPETLLAQLLMADYRDFVYENYLQLPDNTAMNELRQAYESNINAIINAQNPMEKYEALNLMRDRIFSENMYSLSPGKTPSNRDFVNYFLLENHKGFCTHFATAGVILCRMAGIPARYATGYVIVGDDFNNSSKQPNGSYSFDVKDNRSHAWTEIYIDGYGWQPFEFTPGYSNQTIDTTPATSAAETTAIAETTTTAAAESTEPAESTTEETDAATDMQSTDANNNTTVVTVTTQIGVLPGSGGKKSASIPESVKIIIFFILLIAASIAFIIIRRNLILKYRRKHFCEGKNSQQMEYLYQYTEKLLKTMGVEQKDMIYADFAKHAEEKLGSEYLSPGSFVSFVDIALKAEFSKIQPTDNEIRLCKTLASTLAEKKYDRSGSFEKIIMKYILALI